MHHKINATTQTETRYSYEVYSTTRVLQAPNVRDIKENPGAKNSERKKKHNAFSAYKGTRYIYSPEAPLNPYYLVLNAAAAAAAKNKTLSGAYKTKTKKNGV